MARDIEPRDAEVAVAGHEAELSQEDMEDPMIGEEMRMEVEGLDVEDGRAQNEQGDSTKGLVLWGLADEHRVQGDRGDEEDVNDDHFSYSLSHHNHT